MTGDDRRVLFLGDSFTAGVGDPTGLGWVGRAAAAAAAAGTPITAYGLGVRRETSADVAARWRREAAPRLDPEADCRLVLCLGANDTSEREDGPGLRVEPEESLRVLARVLDEADAAGLPAWVVGPPPLGEPVQRERVRALSERFAAVCAARAVPFAAVADALDADGPWLAEARAGDGYHPGAVGYAALAALVLDAGFVGWLRAPAARAAARTSPG